jgi:hypothetical protein
MRSSFFTPRSGVNKYSTPGVQKVPQKTYPSLGLGENIRFQGPFVSGAALIYNGTVFHLSAFGHDDKGTAEVKGPFQRFSQRGRKT